MKKPLSKFFLLLDIIAVMGTSFLQGAEPVPGTHILSSAAIIMDAGTGGVLFGKDMDMPMYPASTTKIMTALLLIEYAESYGWDETVTMSPYAISSIGSDASNIGLSAGDEITLEECLYAILLASANEVCAGVAEHIAGTSEGFTYMMNARAEKIGAVNTSFSNPHGLPDKNHITTAYDIALIMRESIKEPAFVDAISTQSYEIRPTGASNTISITNKNLLIMESSYYRDYVVGGKTGYTSAARHTLASYGVQDGAEFICVVMRASAHITYSDTISLFEYGFSSFYENSPLHYTNAD